MKKLDDFKKLVDKTNPDKPMDEETMGIFLSMIMAEKTDPKFMEVMTLEDESLKSDAMWVPKIFVSRLNELSTVRLTRAAAISIIVNLTSAGSAVMFAYYIHRKCAPDSLVTMETLGEIFPMGFFSEKQLEQLWEAQKLMSPESQEKAVHLGCYMVKDNLLDYVGTWKEIDIKEHV